MQFYAFNHVQQLCKLIDIYHRSTDDTRTRIAAVKQRKVQVK